VRLEQVKVPAHARGTKYVFIDMMTAPDVEERTKLLREMGFCYSRWEPQPMADQIKLHDVTWRVDELPDWVMFPRPDGSVVGQVSYAEWLNTTGFELEDRS
jgi:hypothetical protein